jgi:hypothetical protein
MTRHEAIVRITATLSKLSDERVETLAEIAQGFAEDALRPPEDEHTRRAIAQGLAEARRGDFASDSEVADAYKRFRG